MTGSQSHRRRPMTTPNCPLCLLCSRRVTARSRRQHFYPSFVHFLHSLGLTGSVYEVGVVMCNRCDPRRFVHSAPALLAGMIRLLPRGLTNKVEQSISQLTKQERSVVIGHQRVTAGPFPTTGSVDATVTVWLSSEAVYYRVKPHNSETRASGGSPAEHFDLRVRETPCRTVGSADIIQPGWAFPVQAARVWSPVTGAYIFDECVPVSPNANWWGR